MSRALAVLFTTLLVAVAVAPQVAVSAQTTPQVSAHSLYLLNRYGFAFVNESVAIKNNYTVAVTVPDIAIGVGTLNSSVVSANVTGAQLGASTSPGTFLVTGGGSLAAGATTHFTLKILLQGAVSHATNGSMLVNMLTAPSFSVQLTSLTSIIQMPTSTTLLSSPPGFSLLSTGTNTSYSRVQGVVDPQAATTSIGVIKDAASQDLHPLRVFAASRVISSGIGGTPTVTDTISFENLGTTPLTTLVVTPLLAANGKITVIPASEPPLLNPVTFALRGYSIVLTAYATLGLVQPDANYTIVYRYNLDSKYFTMSGGSVNLNLPETPPVAAFSNVYRISMSLPDGIRATKGDPSGVKLTNASPLQTGRVALAYGLSIGWALDSGVPAAAGLFIILLIGLFVSRSRISAEEETEEESATERASAMIKAFEEKTGLINQVLAEIPVKDPNERNKAYFDELRGRLDSYRSRALQRLNEVKQKSTTQKFFDLLNQLHTTEREVDRAAKDTLNLYEQFYTNRMRKEVFDRLLPTYKKRLEKALDQLSEELHVAQREAKLL